jgi:hypothetical protein
MIRLSLHDICFDNKIDWSTDCYFNSGSSYNQPGNIHHCQNHYLKQGDTEF